MRPDPTWATSGQPQPDALEDRPGARRSSCCPRPPHPRGHSTELPIDSRIRPPAEALPEAEVMDSPGYTETQTKRTEQRAFINKMQAQPGRWGHQAPRSGDLTMATSLSISAPELPSLKCGSQSCALPNGDHKASADMQTRVPWLEAYSIVLAAPPMQHPHSNPGREAGGAWSSGCTEMGLCSQQSSHTRPAHGTRHTPTACPWLAEQQEAPLLRTFQNSHFKIWKGLSLALADQEKAPGFTVM